LWNTNKIFGITIEELEEIKREPWDSLNATFLIKCGVIHIRGGKKYKEEQGFCYRNGSRIE
jgi:hypothetical protein